MEPLQHFPLATIIGYHVAGCEMWLAFADDAGGLGLLREVIAMAGRYFSPYHQRPLHLYPGCLSEAGHDGGW